MFLSIMVPWPTCHRQSQSMLNLPGSYPQSVSGIRDQESPLTVYLYELLDLFGKTMGESSFRQRSTLLQRVDRFDFVTLQF